MLHVVNDQSMEYSKKRLITMMAIYVFQKGIE
jgi:hypothetical protein